MFEPALKSLGHRGRLLEIASAGDRRVSFDLRDFYPQRKPIIWSRHPCPRRDRVECASRSPDTILRAGHFFSRPQSTGLFL
jgi:hypothetical protein